MVQQTPPKPTLRARLEILADAMRARLGALQ